MATLIFPNPPMQPRQGTRKAKRNTGKAPPGRHSLGQRTRSCWGDSNWKSYDKWLQFFFSEGAAKKVISARSLHTNPLRGCTHCKWTCCWSQRPLKLLSPEKKIEGSLEVKLPTIWTDVKQRWEESETRTEEKRRDETRRDETRREEKRKEEDRTSKKESLRRKKIQVREKVGKSRNTLFFQWCVAPEGRKVGSLSGGCGAMWSDERWKIARRCGAKHVSKSKCTKHTMLGPLLEIEMSKSARRCGAKHIWKSTCTKHTMLGPLLEVDMSKKRTPLLREAHLEVKMYNARTTFGSWHVEKVHAIVARSTFRSQKCKKTDGFGHVWKLRCRKSVCHCGAKKVWKSKCTKHTMHGPLLEVDTSKKCTHCGAKHISKSKV